MMNRLKEAILPFDPQRPEDIVPPSRRARASLVCIAFALGAVSGLGTLNIIHYVVFLIAALAAGLSVNHSVPGLSMILNMAPFRHGDERTGRLNYTVGTVAATTAVGGVLATWGVCCPGVGVGWALVIHTKRAATVPNTVAVPVRPMRGRASRRTRNTLPEGLASSVAYDLEVACPLTVGIELFNNPIVGAVGVINDCFKNRIGTFDHGLRFS